MGNERYASLFSAACAKLREVGFDLQPTNIPGLTLVNGPGVWDQELNMAQVEHLAMQSVGFSPPI